MRNTLLTLNPTQIYFVFILLVIGCEGKMKRKMETEIDIRKR